MEIVSTVVIPARTVPFAPRERFVENTDRNAPVRLGGDLGKFLDLFGGIENAAPETTLQCHAITHPREFRSVLEMLKGKITNTLPSQLFFLLQQQPNPDQNGVLWTCDNFKYNWHTNLFAMNGADGESHLIDLSKAEWDDWWEICVDPVINLARLKGKHHFFAQLIPNN